MRHPACCINRRKLKTLIEPPLSAVFGEAQVRRRRLFAPPEDAVANYVTIRLSGSSRTIGAGRLLNLGTQYFVMPVAEIKAHLMRGAHFRTLTFRTIHPKTATAPAVGMGLSWFPQLTL
jgi:hypothetical protein